MCTNFQLKHLQNEIKLNTTKNVSSVVVGQTKSKNEL